MCLYVSVCVDKNMFTGQTRPNLRRDLGQINQAIEYNWQVY